MNVNPHNNQTTFNLQVATLLQILIVNRNFFFPPPFAPRIMYQALLNNKFNMRTTTMRGLLRYFVSVEAQANQITNEQVISRATDMFMRTAGRQEKLDYKTLSDQVNFMIRGH